MRPKLDRRGGVGWGEDVSWPAVCFDFRMQIERIQILSTILFFFPSTDL